MQPMLCTQARTPFTANLNHVLKSLLRMWSNGRFMIPVAVVSRVTFLASACSYLVSCYRSFGAATLVPVWLVMNARRRIASMKSNKESCERSLRSAFCAH